MISPLRQERHVSAAHKWAQEVWVELFVAINIALLTELRWWVNLRINLSRILLNGSAQSFDCQSSRMVFARGQTTERIGDFLSRQLRRV